MSILELSGVIYTAKVKWNGDHYFSGEEVTGSKYRITDGKHEIYDDEERYIDGLGDFTRYQWVEIDVDTLTTKPTPTEQDKER